jgi:hypothetical protein
MATRSLLALAVITKPTRLAEDVSARGLANERRVGLEGDRSGRPCDPATIEDILPEKPSEAWIGMCPERL